jgi:hypothetical protein
MSNSFGFGRKMWNNKEVYLFLLHPPLLIPAIALTAKTGDKTGS